MRTLAFNASIDKCVAVAGVTGEVNVVASWKPCRLLVWSTDSAGDNDVGKVVSKRCRSKNPSTAAQVLLVRV